MIVHSSIVYKMDSRSFQNHFLQIFKFGPICQNASIYYARRRAFHTYKVGWKFEEERGGNLNPDRHLIKLERLCIKL